MFISMKTVYPPQKSLSIAHTAAKTGEANEHYGPYAAGDLADLMGQHVPWAIDAAYEHEIRAFGGSAR